MKEKMVTNSPRSSIKKLLNNTVSIIRFKYPNLSFTASEVNRIRYIRWETYIKLRNNL